MFFKRRLVLAACMVLVVPMLMAACEFDENGLGPGEEPVGTPAPEVNDVTPTPTPEEPATPTPAPDADATPVTEPEAKGEVAVVMLEEVAGSGETGVGVLRAQNGETELTVALLSALFNGQAVDAEVSIWTGACDAPEEVSFESVAAVQGGVGVGTVDEPLDDLLQQDLAITVHEPRDAELLIACGNLADATPVSEMPEVPAPSPDDQTEDPEADADGNDQDPNGPEQDGPEQGGQTP